MTRPSTQESDHRGGDSAATADRPWHAEEAAAVAERLGVDPGRGLDGGEVLARLRRYGQNLLEAAQEERWYRLLARQFVDMLIGILLVAAGIAAAVGETLDAAAILAIVLLNGVLGFVQEWRAERALAALHRMLAPRCRVLRGGAVQEIDAAALVPGDVVLLEAGDRVPADCRVVEALRLEMDESTLTGESVAVAKDVAAVAPDTPLAARACMAWMGTSATRGRGRALVVATGKSTELGRIARWTGSIEREATPLQRRLGTLGKQIGIAGMAVALVVGVAGAAVGKPPLEMFFTSVALVVAVVPEGLPAVVTITLALGVRSMVRRRALLRRLRAAEALGAATVICTDKTGTLTRNEMTVQRLWLPAGEVEVTGTGYAPEGRFESGGEPLDPDRRSQLEALLTTGVQCNGAALQQDGEGWHAVGDPTEAALLAAAAKAGLPHADRGELLAEFSFDAGRKRMSVVVAGDGARVVHAKGAPEVLGPRCTRIAGNGSGHPLDDEAREAFDAACRRLAEEGLRTLALARRELPAQTPLEDADAVECELTLLGVVGILDPPRPEVPRAIALARAAGIRTVMITGDAPGTALAIARAIGLPAGRAVTGGEVDSLDDEALGAALDAAAVFARTTPEHKLRIVSFLQERGEVVGMTGDGVNDAPALKKADIGIAMGLRGTDVARGAADIVLTDDNFASIINAVEEGRRQYDNVQKFVRYLLSSNTGEVLAISVNILLGGSLILVPVQILWMNLVTDSVTAVALGLEPAEKGVMQRPPRSLKERVLDRAGAGTVLLLGTYIGVATLWLFHRSHTGEASVARAQTLAFTGIVVLEKFNVLNFRSLREPLARAGFWTNPWVLVAWCVAVGLQLCAVYLPPLQRMLHTVPLGWGDWAWILAAAVPVFVVPELSKWLRGRRRAA